MRASVLAILGIVLAAPSFAQTGAILTEQADTAEWGRWTAELGAEAFAAEPSPLTGEDRSRWDGPILRFTGAAADNVELDLEWVSVVGTSAEPYRGATLGPGDVTLRAKVRHFRSRRLTLSSRFGVILPQTPYNDELFRPLGLGPNTLRAFVEALGTCHLRATKIHANLGLFLHDEVYRPHEQRDFLSFGLALDHPVSRQASLIGEWAGRAGESARGAPKQGEARAGVRWHRTRWQIDVVARRGLVAAEGSWGAGFAVLLGAEKRRPRVARQRRVASGPSEMVQTMEVREDE